MRALNSPPARVPQKSVMSAGCIGLVLATSVVVIYTLLIVWPVMLLLGVLASMTGWPIALGFWQTFVLTLIVRLLVANASPSS